MRLPFQRKPESAADSYVLGNEIAHPRTLVSVPRSSHLLVLGESGSGKGSVQANIIKQEVKADGEVWMVDLKHSFESSHYSSILSRQAGTLADMEELLRDFNREVDLRAEQWRGKTRNLTDKQATHRLLVIDEAGDAIRSGSEKKQSDSCVTLIRSALSRSRALNMTIVISTQDPRMSSSLPYRNLLQTTVALRLNSRAEAVMALGEDAVRRGARPWQIQFNRPGDAYLWDPEQNTVRYLHVPFVTDEEIHSLRYLVGKDPRRQSASESRSGSQTQIDVAAQGATTTAPCEMRDEGNHHGY